MRSDFPCPSIPTFPFHLWTLKGPQSIRSTGRPNFGFSFDFGALQLVNSVVAESRVQSLSCGGRECARRRESLAALSTSAYGTSAASLYVFDLLFKTFRLCGLGPDTIDYRFRF